MRGHTKESLLFYMFEPQRNKTYILTSAHNEYLNQIARGPPCQHEETLHAWLSKMCPVNIQIRPRGYKTFFMLNSTEYDFYHANKSQITNNSKFFLPKLS